MGLNIKPWTMPMTARHIVIPEGWELELRRQAVVDSSHWCAGCMRDVLLGREIIWVETLGL